MQTADISSTTETILITGGVSVRLCPEAAPSETPGQQESEPTGETAGTLHGHFVSLQIHKSITSDPFNIHTADVPFEESKR